MFECGYDYDSCKNSPCRYASASGCTNPSNPINQPKYRCTTDKYGNFTKDKIYQGHVKNYYLDGRIGNVTIDDDEHDSFMVYTNGKTASNFIEV